MSWIKENKFLAGLAGGTLVAMVALYFWGSGSKTKYQEKLDSYNQTSAEVKGFEKLPLYPNDENIQAKQKALADYKVAVEGLQKEFEKYIPGKGEAISSEQFTANLKQADEEFRAAFAEANIEFPEEFFVGFEKYRSEIVPAEHTAILDQQLKSIKETLNKLVSSRVAKLNNLHRIQLREEGNASDTHADDSPARPLSYEISFTGKEDAVRKLISAITNTEEGFNVIRAMRISSSVKTAPAFSTARFDAKSSAASSPAAESSGSDLADGGFVLPGEEPAAEETPAPEPEAAPAAPADSSRVLAQILGGDNVDVYLVIDSMQFAPAKPLP